MSEQGRQENLKDAFIRDLTKVGSRSKSEVRQRLEELLHNEVTIEKLGWMNGERCHHCGKEIDNNGLCDWCADCLENA